MIDIRSVLDLFDGVEQKRPNQWQCKCPCHDDRKASLTITKADDKIMLFDHAGCATKDILDAIGLTWADIGNKEEEPEGTEWEQQGYTERYDYYDSDGYAYSKLRRREADGSKTIRYATIEGNKLISWHKLKSGTDALFNFGKLAEAIRKGLPVYYAEGEKDCLTLEALGRVCVTAGGASDWRRRFAQYFKGAKLTIFADNDKAGQELAERIEKDVLKYCWCCRIITPSNMEHGDITDELDKHTSTEAKQAKFNEILKDAKNSYVYPDWIYFDKNGNAKINADLLANAFVTNSHMMVVKSKESDNDLYYTYERGVYVRVSKGEIEKRLSEYIALGNASASMLSNAVRLAISRAVRHSFNELNSNAGIINVRNGLVDIRNKTIKPHTPNILTTVQLNCNYYPDNVTETPTWNKFINDFCTADGTTDEPMKESLLQYLGLIISNIDGSKAKKCCMMYSPNGNSGKSKMIEIVTELIGSENVAVIPFSQMSNSRWATSAAYGKRLVSVGDQGSMQIEDSSVFKQMTGGDELDAEFKGKDKFKFKFRGCILIGTNTLPYFADDKGNHMAERLMILHCRNTIPEEQRDRDIAEKCFKERDGIFTQLLDALNRLLENNLSFIEGESSKLCMNEYRMKSDTLYYFVKGRCKEVKGESVKTSEFNTAYIDFCEEMGINAVSVRNIVTRMEGLGFSRKTVGGYQHYSGITLGAIDNMEEIQDIPF